MRSRPPEYLYFQGYLMVLAALWAFGLGLERLDDWRYFGISFVILLGAFLFFAYLAWWRRNYEEWHPGNPDIRVSILQRTADELSTKFISLLGRIVSRRSQK